MPEAVTLREIAKAANVNHGTVSRILNGRTDMAISPETRRRVIEFARAMGYRPNKAARALTTGKTQCVSLWLPTIESAFYARILHKLQTLASADEYTAIIRYSGDSGRDLCEALAMTDVDGVIAVDVYKDRDDLPGNPVAGGKPLALVGVHAADVADCVVVDLARGVRDAIDAFAASGCVRIAYAVTQGRMASDRDIRCRAYRENTERLGLRAETIELSCGRKACARAEIAASIKERGLPDAILCQNDDIAIGAFRGAVDSGFEVPRDVSIVGCDGVDDLEYFNPSISTIAQPVDAMCETAWAFLARRIASPDIPLQRRTLEASLVRRESLKADGPSRLDFPNFQPA